VYADSLQKLILQHPKNIVGWYRLGNYYRDQRRFELALASYKKTLKCLQMNKNFPNPKTLSNATASLSTSLDHNESANEGIQSDKTMKEKIGNNSSTTPINDLRKNFNYADEKNEVAGSNRGCYRKIMLNIDNLIFVCEQKVAEVSVDRDYSEFEVRVLTEKFRSNETQ
jgi:tetratricopeptide (TPR) repeat protein